MEHPTAQTPSGPSRPALWLQPAAFGHSPGPDASRSEGGGQRSIDPAISCLRVAVESAGGAPGGKGPLFHATGDRGGLMGRLRRGAERRLHTMADLVESLGSHTALAVDSEDPGLALETVAEARRAGLLERLWITSGDPEVLQALRADSPATRLLHRCDPQRAQGGPERHAADIRHRGIEGVMVPCETISAGLVALFDRFGRIVGVEGARHVRLVRAAALAGADIACGPSVEVLREGCGL